MSHKEAKRERQEGRVLENEFGKLGPVKPDENTLDPNPTIWRVMIEQKKDGGVQVLGFPSENFAHARGLILTALVAITDFYVGNAPAQKSNLIQIPKLSGIPPLRH